MMIKKLSSLWIFSDIDGTMVEAPNPIPRRNLEALQRFTENGGHFAISTGRTVEAALQYANDLPVNVPSIIFNGGAIYDFCKKENALCQIFIKNMAGLYQSSPGTFP